MMMSSLKMMDFAGGSLMRNQESKNGGIMVGHDHDGVDNNVSDLSDVSSVVSSDSSDLFEEVNSSGSSSPTSSSPISGSSSGKLASAGPLQDMSSLLQDLPFKRGLSKHYNGKSQSFTSLSNVRCLEDLAKPENPHNKKLKSCRSYGGLLESAHGSSSNYQPNRSSSCSSRLISKKGSSTTRGSCSSLCVKRNPSFLGNSRPPVPLPAPPPLHRSSGRSSFTTQTPLFALGV